jgi:CRP-like cAMP-binding protein
MILPQEMPVLGFLQDLDEPYRNQLSRMARLQECLQGTVLFREGQDWPSLCFVLNGTVDLEVEEPAGESVEIDTVGPGDLLGWSAVLGHRAMTATARAATRCRLAVLDVRQVLALCERDPKFGLAFLRQIALVLSKRLDSTRRHLAIARTVGQRLPSGTVREGKG